MGVRTRSAGASFRFGFPSWTPKPRGKEITTQYSPTPARFLSPARCLSRFDAAEPHRHFWAAIRRRRRRAPGLQGGRWGRVSKPARGEDPERPAPAHGQRRRCLARPARGRAWERLAALSFLPVPAGSRTRARRPGEGRVGEEAAGENREPLSPFEKKVGTLGGKKTKAPSQLFFEQSFPRAFCLCELGRRSPGSRCRRGGCACAPRPAPPPSSLGSSAPSPRGAKWLPSHLAGRGLQRRLLPPPLRAAARPGGGAARGRGAGPAGGSAPWRRTGGSRAGGGSGGLLTCGQPRSGLG